MRDLQSSLWHAGSLVVGMWTLSCSMWNLAAWLGIEPGPLHGEREVLVTAPPGKSQEVLFLLPAFSAVYPYLLRECNSPSASRPSCCVLLRRPCHLAESFSMTVSTTSMCLRKGLPLHPVARCNPFLLPSGSCSARYSPFVFSQFLEVHLHLFLSWSLSPVDSISSIITWTASSLQPCWHGPLWKPQILSCPKWTIC